jgi:hypothetical protein
VLLFVIKKINIAGNNEKDADDQADSQQGEELRIAILFRISWRMHKGNQLLRRV